MNDKNKDFEKEKSALRRLFADKPVPSLLHLKIINLMKNENLIHTPRPLLRASIGGILTALLLAVAFVSVGFVVGKNRNASPIAIMPEVKKTSKPQYALFVRNDDVPPADPSQQFEEYSAWLKNLKTARFADGEALHGKAWSLKKNMDKTTVDNMVIEGNKSAFSGYFIFEAEDESEAIKIAQTCPHLNYKGSMELRELYK